MNTKWKAVVIGAALFAGLSGTAAARDNVSFSLSFGVPAYTYYTPAPTYYYSPPPAVYYEPAPVYYAPAYTYYDGPRYRYGYRHHYRHHHRTHDGHWR
jgi:hypothetical protein